MISEAYNIKRPTGVHIQNVDNKGRVFVNASMRRYFGLSLSDKQENDDLVCLCFMGFSAKAHCLILFNEEEFLKQSQKRSVEKDDDDDDPTVIDLKKRKESYAWDARFPSVEIKSSRIQLKPRHRKILDLPDDDKRIVIAAYKNRYEVWRYSIFKKEFPDVLELIDE